MSAGTEMDVAVAEENSKARGWSFLRRSIASSDNNGSIVNPREQHNPILPIATLTRPISNAIIRHQDMDTFSVRSKIDSELTDPDTSPLEESIQSPNIVVPSFEILPQASIWFSVSRSLTKLANNLSILSNDSTQQRHLYTQSARHKLQLLSSNGAKPVRVLLIGVHGFFPTRMIRPFIGEPTGTSLKFITEAETIVQRYFKKYNTEVEINKIGLEREGVVFERVDFFYDVLVKLQDELNQADFIYFVAHSQGCPVTIMLLGKLLSNGIIKSNTIHPSYDSENPIVVKKIISILAMAGVNNGPFYGADQTLFVRAYSTIENKSMLELFEFQKPESLQSKTYIENLRVVIGNNVKISFIGSINDQLIPLYSSICLLAQHPNMFRATFIDKNSKTPAFITRIVDIAGKLLNLGYQDHGLIKEISASLAGPLTGGGHSTVYNEAQVYELGLKFALETVDLNEDIPLIYKPYKFSQLNTNPFNLPWCMRGLLFETNRNLGNTEIELLIKEFDSWKPDTKPLRDVKYRLNGLRSKF